MKTLLEYINENNIHLGNIYFELDESSLELLSESARQLISEGYYISCDMITEMGKYYDKIHTKKRTGNRLVWQSPDGDNLRMGTHATEREDRPTDKGGDGEHIDERELINMFVYAWKDINEMYVDGYLDHTYVNSFVIECQAYIQEKNDKLIYDGARPDDKKLWSAFMVKDGPHYTLDIVMKTIFRGMFFSHGKAQERLRILRNGKVQQQKPR